MIPPKTRKQIADEYGISTITLRRRLKKLKVPLPSGNLLPAHQRLVYERLGYPQGVKHTAYQAIPLPTAMDQAEP